MKTRLIAAMALLLSFSTSVFAADLNRLLSVKGMSCEACPVQVELELRKLRGVNVAQVDLKSGQARVVTDERVKTGELVRAIKNAGFEAKAESNR